MHSVIILAGAFPSGYIVKHSILHFSADNEIYVKVLLFSVDDLAASGKRNTNHVLT